MSERIPLIGEDHDTNTLHAERVSLAHQVLSGVPDDQVYLGSFYPEGQSMSAPLCGTIACGAGWLALHPEFQAMGLRVCHGADHDRRGVQFLTREGGWRYGFDAMHGIFVTGTYPFGIKLVQNLFEARTFGEWDDVLLRMLKTSKCRHATGKELLLLRLRYAYQHHCGRVDRDAQ